MGGEIALGVKEVLPYLLGSTLEGKKMRCLHIPEKSDVRSFLGSAREGTRF